MEAWFIAGTCPVCSRQDIPKKICDETSQNHTFLPSLLLTPTFALRLCHCPCHGKPMTQVPLPDFKGQANDATATAGSKKGRMMAKIGLGFRVGE
jgi:hypothetical protein